MRFTDYEFYKDKHCGTLVPNARIFERFVVRASFFINAITLNKIKDDVIEEVKFATCAVIDAMYKVEQDGGVKSSESVGSHSVSYKGKTTEEKTYYKVAKVCLSHTGLLYRGVDNS